MVYLCLSIDVEPDCSPTWHYADPLAFRGVTTGIAEILHPLFMQYGVAPTYLLNNVVLENKECVEVFRKLCGKFELGTHLHSEFIEPEKKHGSYAGIKSDANQCFLDPRVEYEKMENITNLFIRRFGHRPSSFRAGRFAAGRTTIESLAALQYKVDTSVTPHIIWKADSSRENEIDYRRCPVQPYLTNGADFPEESSGQILEIPVTIIPYCSVHLVDWVRLLTKGKRVKENPLWLRPSYSDFKQLSFIAEYMIDKSDIAVLNMMFHNVEVLPGLSPYCSTERECEKYIADLKAFFSFCNNRGITGVTLEDAREILIGNGRAG